MASARTERQTLLSLTNASRSFCRTRTGPHALPATEGRYGVVDVDVRLPRDGSEARLHDGPTDVEGRRIVGRPRGRVDEAAASTRRHPFGVASSSGDALRPVGRPGGRRAERRVASFHASAAVHRKRRPFNTSQSLGLVEANH